MNFINGFMGVFNSERLGELTAILLLMVVGLGLYLWAEDKFINRTGL